MNKCAPFDLFVIDTSGLHEIANATGNLKTVAIGLLSSGLIAVPTWAWLELQEAYPDDAEELATFITKRVKTDRAITVRAAKLAEALNSGFSKGPYDNGVVLYTAAFARNECCGVITSAGEVAAYAQFECSGYDLSAVVAAFSEG